MILQLGNYWFAENAFNWQIAQMDRELRGETLNKDAVNKWDGCVGHINSLVMVLFVVGVILLGIFVSENYGAGTKEKCACQKVCCVLTNGVTTGTATVPDTGRK